MALKTERIDPRGDEHARIGGTVGRVANQASLGAHGVVLEDERSALVHVALEADQLNLLTRGGPDLTADHGAVRVMTIGAADQPFQHAMAERLLEIYALLLVAGKAQRILLGLQQVLRLGVVD